METLKILWLNHRDPKHPQAGGSEVHFWEIAKRFTSWGHEVTLLSEKFEGAPDRQMLGDVEVYRAGGRASVHFYALWKYLRRFKREYDLVVDDVAHAVPWFTPIYVKEPIVAVVHHVHREILKLEIPFPYSKIASLAERSIPRFYKDVPFIAVSESTRDDLENLGVRRDMIRVVHNGIDHELYEPRWKSKTPYPHVLYLGRIKRYKNICHILKAMKIVAEKVPEAKLSIAGKGDKTVEKEVEAAIKELGLEDTARFYGEVTEDEKIRLFQQAWVYVTASRREGWGITVLEAAACGTATVAYDTAGLRDAVIDGETGLLASYGNIDAFAQSVITLLKDGQLRRRLSQKAAERSKEFSWDKAAKEILESLKDALEKRK
ncbi:MAG: glycosyltransferase family 4 protein [Candidatus Bathyarchaeota archaeon]|nr:glycosyltransferase family 4 protein [Candidatus Bathyarchaeota archaeon]